MQKTEGMQDAVIDFMEQVHNQDIKEESENHSSDEEHSLNDVADKMDKESLTEFFKDNKDVAKLFRIDTTKELPMVSRIIS